MNDTPYRRTDLSEFEEMQRLSVFVRHGRAVADMTKDEIDQMTEGRMGAEHDHLNAAGQGIDFRPVALPDARLWLALLAPLACDR